MIKITVEEGRAAIESPYNPQFVSRIKKMGGKWDSIRKVWTALSMCCGDRAPVSSLVILLETC